MIEFRLSRAFQLSLLAVPCAVAPAQPSRSVAHYSPGLVWVQFEEGTSISPGAGKTGLAAFDQEAERFGVSLVERTFFFVDRVAETREIAESTRKLQRIYTVHHDEAFDSGRVAAALTRDPSVVYAEPHFVREPMWDTPAAKEKDRARREAPNDPLYAQAPYMDRMRMADAWDVVKGEQGDVVIAVVEMGADTDHEDLRGALWTNAGEIPGNGVDDDGNGFVDDMHGWNFETNSPIASGDNHDTNPYFIAHAAAVGGSAAAVVDNGIGLAGTSWNARLMPVAGYGVGIAYAALNGASIINASYGGYGYTHTEKQIIQSALDEGALVVAAAGNASINSDKTPSYPGSFGIELGVGGTLAESDVNYYNFGRSVNVFAAGRNVVVPVPGNDYGREFGTSFAAPLVAGIAALVKTANPDFTPYQVREQVRLTADNIEADNDAALTGLLGSGRVNAYRAVTESGFPAIRMTEYQLVGGDRALQSGESAEIAAKFVNYLSDTENLTIEWFSDEEFVEFENGPVSIGVLRAEEGADIRTRFKLAEDTPYRARFFVSARSRDGSYDDAPDIVRLIANEGKTYEHMSGAMGFPVTTEGNLGFLDTRIHEFRSDGIWVRDANGQRRPVMWEGGLLVASGPDAVSDCLSSDELRYNPNPQHMDLVPKRGVTLEVREPGHLVAQEARMELVDAGAANPIGVEVLQESFVDTATENEDFAILRYTLRNPTDREMTNIHVGLMFNWRVSSSRDGDHVGFDATRNLGIQQNAASNPTLAVGTMPLSDNASVHYKALRFSESRTDRTKWSYLTGGIQNPSSGADDWMQVIGAGPFTIDSGQEVQVGFAVVTGKSREDLFQNADNAKVLWESTIRQAPTAQFIQNVDGPAVDVYLDDTQIQDDWTFQSATHFEALSPGEHTIDVVAGGAPENAQPLSSLTIHTSSSTHYHVLAQGKGEDVDIVAVENVRKRHEPAEMATFYVTHGARDLLPVDVQLLQPGAESVPLLNDAAYGAFGEYVAVTPDLHDIEVTTSADGLRVNVFQFDLSGLAQQAFVLSLSGSGTSAREGLTMMGVQTDGTVFYPSSVTRSGKQTTLPEEFALHGNFPNPFNPHTTVLVDLPVAAQVSIAVFDVLGRLVLRTLPEQFEAGHGRMVRIDAGQLASGAYAYRVHTTTSAGTEVRAGQMVIVK